MDEQHQSQPLSSPSPSPPGGGGEEVNSETKSKSAVRCKNTFFGRHRISAAITRLQNEINIIKEELQQLENTGESSTVCLLTGSSPASNRFPILCFQKQSVRRTSTGSSGSEELTAVATTDGGSESEHRERSIDL